MSSKEGTIAERLASLEQKILANERITSLALSSQEKAINTALDASERAINKADAATEKRMDSMNEFRAQLKDQATTFLTRFEYEGKHESLVERVSELADRINKMQGAEKGIGAVWYFIVGLIGVASSAIMIANIIFKR